MRMLIDTNRYTDLARNDAQAVAKFLDADEIFVPFVVLAELRSGFRNGTLSAKNELGLVKFLSNPKVRCVSPDEQTTHFYADVYALLRSQGTPIPTNDIWIAAIAIQHSLPLYTRDHHFNKISQLELA